ncbi:MAG: S41 family peptidase [Pyrinomonadaceae bacterium]
MKRIATLALSVMLFNLFLLVCADAQDLSFERGRHRDMLQRIKEDIKKNYFDPSFKGIDIEANFKKAEEKMKVAVSIGQMSGIIAQFVADFDDSHLFFVPPGKATKTDYGFEMKIIGSQCFVTRLDSKSDAAQKGLEIGDEIVSFEGLSPRRENLWKLTYLFYRLRPRMQIKLSLVKPSGKNLALDIAAKIIPGKRVLDANGQDLNQIIRDEETAYYKSVKQYIYDKTPGIFVWKMPSFSLEPERVDDILEKAKKASLILDLRGNGGGRVDMTLRLIGNVFPSDVKLYDEKSRKDTKSITAKSRKNGALDGKLIVLIDSQSASASEIFSKVVQLEKRGVVIGDLSAGAVMESRYFGHESGVDVIAFYGASVTVADLIMKDGKSLEKIGVLPDEMVVPTGKDLAEKRDIVLARAFELLGVKITAEEAGKIFPNEYGNY